MKEGQDFFLTLDLAWATPFAALVPPEVGGRVEIGEDEYGRPVTLDWGRLISFHGILVGSTGSGKSTLAMTIAAKLVEHNIAPVVIDPAGEYGRFFAIVCEKLKLPYSVVDMHESVLDVFELPVPEEVLEDEEARESALDTWSSGIADAVRASVGLHDIQYGELKRALVRAGEVGELLATFEGSVDYMMRDLHAKLSTLVQGLERPNLRIGELLERKVPLVLTYKSRRGVELPLDRARFLTNVLLTQIYMYNVARGVRSEPSYVVFIDEAHNMLKNVGGESALVKAYRTTRKFGFGFLTITQLPFDIPRQLYQLAAYKIYLTGGDAYVNDVVALEPSLTREFVDHLKFGGKGAGVLVRHGDPHPRMFRSKPLPEAIEATGGKEGAH